MANPLKLAPLFLFLTGMMQGPAELPEGGLSAGSLQDLCSSSKEMKEVACATYLRGVLEGLAYGNLAGDGYPTFCLPDPGINVAEARAIFLDAVETDPDRQVEDAANLILTALEDSFPCDDDIDDPIVAPTITPTAASHRF